VPEYIKTILAELTFQARSSTDINQSSGVSCRVSIRSLESIVGSAIRRCLALGEKVAVPRITDIRSTYPSITGKLELEYEVADAKEFEIVDDLAKRAVKIVFDQYFQLEDLSSVIDCFENDGVVAEVSQLQPSSAYMEGFSVIPGLEEAVATLVDPKNESQASSAIEFVLEGLHLSNKLNREAKGKGMVYK
jgi:magnesium chelatase subunit I